MVKVNKPKGLIRYASSEAIINRSKFKVSPRIIGYSIVLILLLSVLSVLMLNRKDIDISILRTPGMLFQEQPGNKVSNLYNIKLVNKTFDNASMNIKLENTSGEINIIGNELNVTANEIHEAKFLVLLDKANLKMMNTPLTIGVYKNNQKIDEINTTFLGPKPN
jgi:polyferredoxin